MFFLCHNVNQLITDDTKGVRQVINLKNYVKFCLREKREERRKGVRKKT